MYGKNNPPFKVGDIVRVTDNVQESFGLKLNSLHPIVSISYEMDDWWIGVKCRVRESAAISSGEETNWRHTIFKPHNEGLSKEIHDIQTMGYKG